MFKSTFSKLCSLIILTVLAIASYAELNFESTVRLFFIVFSPLIFLFIQGFDYDQKQKEQQELKKREDKYIKEIKESRALIRQDALNMVSKYLRLNGNIWSNFEIKNQHCSVELLGDETTIIVKELKKDGGKFKILASDEKDLINTFCYNFGENTTYGDLLKLSQELKVQIKYLSMPKKEILNSSKEVEIEEFKPELNDDRNVDL